MPHVQKLSLCHVRFICYSDHCTTYLFKSKAPKHIKTLLWLVPIYNKCLKNWMLEFVFAGDRFSKQWQRWIPDRLHSWGTSMQRTLAHNHRWAFSTAAPKHLCCPSVTLICSYSEEEKQRSTAACGWSQWARCRPQTKPLHGDQGHSLPWRCTRWANNTETHSTRITALFFQSLKG